MSLVTSAVVAIKTLRQGRRQEGDDLECGGNRSATPLWIDDGKRHYRVELEWNQRAVAASLCRRTPKAIYEKPLVVTFAAAVGAGRPGRHRLLRDSPRGFDSRLRCFMDWRPARSGDVLSHHRGRVLDLSSQEVQRQLGAFYRGDSPVLNRSVDSVPALQRSRIQRQEQSRGASGED